MPSYELNRILTGIKEIENAFRQRTGDRYQYIISHNTGSRRTRHSGRTDDRMLVRQNAYHGVEIYFREKDGKQFVSTAPVTPNAFLGSVLGRYSLLDLLIARVIFGTKKKLVSDVNEVLVGAFPVTVLDTGQPDFF